MGCEKCGGDETQYCEYCGVVEEDEYMKQIVIEPTTTERKIKLIIGDGIEGLFVTDRDDNILFRLDDVHVPCESFIDKLTSTTYKI